jgi:hypothetical protein
MRSVRSVLVVAVGGRSSMAWANRSPSYQIQRQEKCEKHENGAVTPVATLQPRCLN